MRYEKIIQLQTSERITDVYCWGRLEGAVAMVGELQRMAFGLFELDPQTGELWKAGFRVRLAGQPFRVLVALLEQPGRVVTRDELLHRVWGANTNIDVEQAISGAIKKIREALGDSAENPRFVETLTKRGYRFIAPVSMSSTPATQICPTHSGGENETGPTQISHLVPMLHVPSLPEKEVESTPVNLPPLVSPSKQERFGKPARAWPPFEPKVWLSRTAVFAVSVALLLSILAFTWFGHRETNPAPSRVTQVTRYVPLSIGPPNVESFLTLTEDGDRILTSVVVGGRSRLSAIIASTGEVQPLSLPDEVASGTLADITRDGSRLLVRSNLSSASEQPLWIVPSAGGSGQRVASVLAHDAAWMPDNVGILYASGNNLYLIRADQGEATPYARLGGRAFRLRWSPDGKLLRFTLMNPVTHTAGLWELNSSDRKPRPVAQVAAAKLPACCGTWTPDGSAYVFQAGDDLWKLSGSGRGAKLSQLTNGPLRFLSPIASRDGSRIYMVGLEAPSGLQQFDEKRRTFRAAPAFLANANRVEYSRDGVWVAWVDVDERLWRARAADGSDRVRLSSDGTEVFLAHWSPDGSRLAVMAREQGGLWQTYLVDAAGGRPQALLRETRNAADPGWSLDGRSLVYGREPDLMGKESGPRNLQIFNLLTHMTEAVPDSEGLFSPRWSPDGAWIAALSLDQKAVMLYDCKLRQWKQLAATSAADPVWSSDSKALYVHAFLADREPVLRIRVPDGTVEAVADLDNFPGKEAANYFFSGLTPANQPLVQPRIGTGNLYRLDLAR